MKKLGFYREFRNQNFPCLKDSLSFKERDVKLNEDILKYLNNGVWLNSLRTTFKCPISNEYIGTPFIYTDGEWFWTTEFIFYVTKYKNDIPSPFFEKMKSKNFDVPSEKELGEELLYSLEEEISIYYG